jgi:hypothetical protein
MQLQPLLKNETWEIVYKHNDTNNKFDLFLFTLLNNILQTLKESIYLQQEQ